MCRTLEVSRSGYCEWRKRSPSPHAQEDKVLSERIVEHFEANRGVYGTRRLKDCLAEEGKQVSMSAKGDCWDNAVAESFFHTLKTECVYLEDFQTREQAQQAVFDCIEVFYNRQRRHSANGNLAPLIYEQFQKAT